MLTPHSTELATFLRLHADEFDLIVLIGEPAGLYMRQCGSIPVVWDKANVFTAYLKGTVLGGSSYRTRAWAAANLPLSYLYERRCLKRANHVWVTSDDEAARLAKTFGVEANAIVPSVAGAPPTHLPVPDPDSAVLVWMSSLDYPPNWDGLQRFLQATAPTFMARNATLRVVGRGADARKAEILAGFPFVDFLGFQEDLATACHGARAAVVPVWEGAGLKLKTITFMQLGLPVFSTTAGIEGIPSSTAAAVSDDSLELVEAALSATAAKLELARSAAFKHVENYSSPNYFRQLVVAALQKTAI